jgi:hypothetical protein
MSILEILVEPVPLGNKLWRNNPPRISFVSWDPYKRDTPRSTHMLLPLSKSSFLHLDLLRKPLSQQLFLFLELGVVELLDFGLAKLARLHLGLTVQLVVRLFGGGDQVEHVHAEEQRTEFSEIAVILIVDYTVHKKM